MIPGGKAKSWRLASFLLLVADNDNTGKQGELKNIPAPAVP
jgi:hypothetical protein